MSPSTQAVPSTVGCQTLASCFFSTTREPAHLRCCLWLGSSFSVSMTQLGHMDISSVLRCPSPISANQTKAPAEEARSRGPQ